MEPPSLQNPNPNSNLSSTISLLQSLTSVAESTLSSVSSFLHNPNPNFVPCPYNSCHRIPPESLFLHSLLCRFGPGGPISGDLGFLQTLHYPNALKPQSETLSQNKFIRSLSDFDADLCFSLEGELAECPLVSNFFYRDCPGVVTIPEPETNKTFILPSTLSKECTNFIDDKCKDCVLEVIQAKILPSEYWALKCEVESWREFPVSYSYPVLKVCAGLGGAKDHDLRRWVISSSPRFAVVIDAAMRDHVFLLLKLCLRAIRREGISSFGLLESGEGKFLCPKLVGSFSWLASQLSVLYGEVSAKGFALGMLRESLLRAGSCMMMYKSGEEEAREGNSSVDCSSGKIFVSQVAAAVAALHERFLLEQRIKALRFGQQVPKPQRINEYLYASARACELREKRPNYRPLLEHDGMLWQRVNNQGSGKAKTREELLAEERDYKRRRMSYRGKKVKRNPTEVLRDIIEEHMEEIKEAGGFGCNVKAAADTVTREKNQHISPSDTIANIYEPRNTRFDPSPTRKDSTGYRKPPLSEYRSRTHGDLCPSDGSTMIDDVRDPKRRQKHQHSENWQERKKSRHNGENKYGSGSSSIHRSSVHSDDRFSHLDRHTHQNGQDDTAAHRAKYNKKDSSDSYRYQDYYDSRSKLTSNSAREISKEEKGYTSESRSINRGSVSETLWPEYVSQDAFDDRYDPSRSYDVYDATYDDVSIGSNHVRSDKHHTATCDAKYSDGQPSHVQGSKRHSRDHYRN